MHIRGDFRCAITAIAMLFVACGGCDDAPPDEELDESFTKPIGEWTPEVCDSGGDEDGDGQTDCGDPDCYVAEACVFDPSDARPPSLPLNGVVSFWDRSSWMFGANGVQRGGIAAMLTPDNIGTVRGRVLDVGGDPLLGAAVAIAGHPDLGRTYTRPDGSFDLAVDVGRRVVLRVTADGHIASDREVPTRLHRATSIADIVLAPHEAEATRVDFMQTIWVGGTDATDGDGARRTALIIPAGVHAKLVFPNGASRPLLEMHVRATEVTVGDRGRQAMMADLPPGTLYTYATEISVDEAEAEHAAGVAFDAPVFMYVDNFLEFPVGTVVPNGFYDRGQLNWAARPNGVVLKVEQVSEGRAVLAGADGPLDSAAMEVLGLTDAERELVAEQFETGDTFWRVPLLHFSPRDLNWGGQYPPGAAPSPDKVIPPCDRCNSEEEGGSVLGVTGQTVGERIALNGTPFTMAYQSQRTVGRKPVITVPVLPGLENLERLVGGYVRVIAAGQVIGEVTYTEASQIPRAVDFTWDGKDQFGRAVQGAAEVEVETALAYRSVYQANQIDVGGVLQGDIGPLPDFGIIPVGDGTTAELNDRGEWILRRRYSETLTTGTYDVAREGLGGWTLDRQHRYDPVGRVMYYGNGQDLLSGPGDDVVRVVSGALVEQDSFAIASPPDGTDARDVLTPSFGYHARAPLGNDGTIYYREGANVRAIDPATDKIFTVAGQLKADDLVGFDENVDNSDGVLATEAFFNAVLDIRFGKDNRLYIMTDRFIWRLDADGTLTRVIGRYTPWAPDPDAYADLSDGAIAADVAVPWDIMDAGSDGTMYLVALNRIYRVTTDGLLRAVAPVDAVCEAPPCGEGEPARLTPLGAIAALAVSPSGDVVFAEDSGIDDIDRASLIRRIRPDGILETLATVPRVSFLEIGPADDIYFSVEASTDVLPGEPASATLGARVLQLTDDGDIVPRIGIYKAPSERDAGGFSKLRVEPLVDGESSARPFEPGGAFSISPSGQFAFIHAGYLLRLEELFPGHSAQNYVIAEPGGAVFDEFSPNGQHLASFETLTATRLWAFDYDADGRLLTATDRDGDITGVERDGSGAPTAIVGPHGVTWRMQTDGDGMLTLLTSPAGEEWLFEYRDGLMTHMTNPRGESWTFEYDDAGRLLSDTQPHGGASTLERDANLNEVLFTTPEGRETTYSSTPPGQALRYSGVKTGDLSAESLQQRDGWTKSWTQDGTNSASRRQAHPLFGMIAAYTAESWVETPGGLRLEGASVQTAETAGADLFSGMSAWSSTSTLGGAMAQRIWDPDDRSLDVTTGEGRSSTVTLDEQARLATTEVPGVEPVSYGYDGSGRLTAVTQGSRQLAIGYDPRGYAAWVTTADGTVALSRDLMGRIEEATRPDASLLSFGWDPLGNLTGLTAPGRTVAYQMTNDHRGDLLTMTTPLGHETTWAFDQDYRLQGMTHADGRSMSASYDSSNRMDRVVLDGDAVDYVYAETGQLASVAGGDADIALEWDGPLPIAVELSGAVRGRIAYTWADETLHLAEADINGTVVAYDFDTDGLPVAIGRETLDYRAGTSFLTSQVVGDVSTTYSYDEYGQLAESNTRVGGTDLLRRRYAYDGLARIVEVVETTAAGESTVTYGYDLLGQLVSADGSGIQTFSHSYAYDPNGNRTAVSNGIDSLVAADVDHDLDDRLVRYGAATFAYTDAGQLTERIDASGTAAYDYGVTGELRGVTLGTGEVVEYDHDALRRRIARRVDGTVTHRFLYAGNINPVAEVDASGNTVSTFIYGTGINVPDTMERGGRSYVFVRDHLGSVRFVVDADDGSVAQALRYDEYGNVTVDTNPGFQPFGFAGGLYDPLTALVRFGARDYDPRIGRWTAADPIGFEGGQANLFVYVRNSPGVWADPAGLFANPLRRTATMLLLSAGVSSFFNGVSNAYEVREQRLRAFAIGVRHGWSGAVPHFGALHAGEQTARANIDACLATPKDPDAYIKTSREHSALGSVFGVAIGAVVGFYFGDPWSGMLVGGAFGAGVQSVLLGGLDALGAAISPVPQAEE